MTKLTSEQQANALISIYTSAGLQVVFDLIEQIVTESENALIGEDPENEKSVLKFHYTAHAQRSLFQQLTRKIDFMVQEGQMPPDMVAKAVATLDDKANANATLNVVPVDYREDQ